MLPYRIGYCPQCEKPIMVQDSDLRWNSQRPNFRKAYMVFSNGVNAKINMSADCLAAPDVAAVYAAVLATGSQAGSPALITYLDSLGMPTKIIPA